MIAPYSLFFVLGILLFECLYLLFEYQKHKSFYLLFWFISLIIYFLKTLFITIFFTYSHTVGDNSSVIYAFNLLFAGGFVVLLNVGNNYILKLNSSRRENLILGTIFLVVALAIFLVQMDSLWLLSTSRFIIGIAYVLIAFGFYRIWLVKKIETAKFLSATFGIYGIVLPLTIVYIISLNIQIPFFLLESVFIVFFLYFLMRFINDYERKSDFVLLAHLENIQQNSPHFFLLLDRKGNVVRVSNSFSELFTLSKKKVHKSKFNELIDPENVDNFMEKWGKVNFGKEAEFDTSLNPVFSEKTDSRYKFQFKPIFDDKRLNYVSVLGQDISPQYNFDQTVRKITTEKDAVEHELEEFLSMASHELQSPLISLEGYVTALSHALKGVDLPDEVLKYPDFINKSVKKVSALIQAILDLSRANPKSTSVSAVDLNHVMARVEGDIFQQQSGMAYELNIAKELPLVNGNLVQLSQLFLNLIKNGIKYSFPDRTPVINVYLAKKEKDWMTIAVQDNGIGIPEEHFNNIFSPMKRLHMREAEGYGLGLTLVKKIVDSHKGTILVESNVNEGSTFFIKLKKFRKSEKK